MPILAIPSEARICFFLCPAFVVAGLQTGSFLSARMMRFYKIIIGISVVRAASVLARKAERTPQNVQETVPADLPIFLPVFFRG